MKGAVCSGSSRLLDCFVDSPSDLSAFGRLCALSHTLDLQ